MLIITPIIQNKYYWIYYRIYFFISLVVDINFNIIYYIILVTLKLVWLMYSCIYFFGMERVFGCAHTCHIRCRASSDTAHARIGGATEHEFARFWKRPGGGHMTRHARTQDRRAGHGWPLMTRPRVHTRRRAGSPARPRPPRGAAESRARGEGAGRREV